jgi:hypothetical protein
MVETSPGSSGLEKLLKDAILYLENLISIELTFTADEMFTNSNVSVSTCFWFSVVEVEMKTTKLS